MLLIGKEGRITTHNNEPPASSVLAIITEPQDTRKTLDEAVTGYLRRRISSPDSTEQMTMALDSLRKHLLYHNLQKELELHRSKSPVQPHQVFESSRPDEERSKDLLFLAEVAQFLAGEIKLL